MGISFLSCILPEEVARTAAITLYKTLKPEQADDMPKCGLAKPRQGHLE
jgi:hypothetical protein